MAYGEQNATVFVELEALIEKLGYGTLDVSYDLNNRRITATTYYGKKRRKYNKDNPQAMQEIADRLIKAMSEKKTEKVTFSVDVRGGNIEQTVWVSSLKKSHEVEGRE